MSAYSVFNGPLAVLVLPRNTKQLLTFAKAVHDAMKDNQDLPSPTPALSEFQANINALDDAETKAAARTKGAVTARDAMKKKVINDLFHLRDYVQGVAEKVSTPAEAATVITGAFMRVKKAPQRDTPELQARSTGVQGQVELTAKAVAHVATYYWEHSPDQVNWTTVPETMKANTTVDGLPWAKVSYFRFRALTRSGKSDYSQIVSLLVQ